MPIAPAPTMTIDLGRSRVRICSSYVTTFSLSCTPGSRRTFEPVEMIALSNVTRSVEPSAFFTSIVFASTNEPRPSYSVTLFFFIKKWMPLTWRVGHLAAAIPRGAEVEVHVTRDAEQLGLVVEDVREVGVAQERLGGDAAHVQADTAPVLLFDDRNGKAELSGSDGRDITAGARAENGDVVVRHASSLSVGGGLGTGCGPVDRPPRGRRSARAQRLSSRMRRARETRR